MAPILSDEIRETLTRLTGEEIMTLYGHPREGAQPEADGWRWLFEVDANARHPGDYMLSIANVIAGDGPGIVYEHYDDAAKVRDRMEELLVKNKDGWKKLDWEVW